MPGLTPRDYRKVKHPKHTMQEVLAFVLKHPSGVGSPQVADALGMSLSDASMRLSRLWRGNLVRRYPVRGEVGRRNAYEATDWGRKYAKYKGLL